LKDRVVSIPETLSELPKKEEEEIRIPITVKIKKSVVQKLNQAKTDTGYTHQEIIEKSLEAFLK